MTQKVYIGDGVYASTDGYGVWLQTERINEVTGRALTHEIYLEPAVYQALRNYVERTVGMEFKK